MSYSTDRDFIEPAIRISLEVVQAAVQGTPKAWAAALDRIKRLIQPVEPEEPVAEKQEWDPPYVFSGQYELEEANPKKHRIWYRPSGEIIYNHRDHEPWCFTPGGRRFDYWCTMEDAIACPRPLRLEGEPDCPAVAAELRGESE